MPYLTVSGRKIYYEEYGAGNAPSSFIYTAGRARAASHIPIRLKNLVKLFMSSASISTAYSGPTRSAMSLSALANLSA